MKQFFCMTFILLIAAGCVTRIDTAVLESYLDKDMRRQTPEDLRKPKPDDLVRILRSVNGGEEEGHMLEGKGFSSRLYHEPWYVWKLQSGRATRYVVYVLREVGDIPGQDLAEVYLFDRKGKSICSWLFSTGWRIAMKNAKFSRFDPLNTDVLTVETVANVGGGDVAKQLFAFSGDSLRFIRAEDSKGGLISNNYIFPNFTLGISIQAESDQEWIKLLTSKNAVDVLGALMYFAGKHIDPSLSSSEIQFVDKDQAKLFNRLMQNKEIQALIEKHCQSANPWIAETARMAWKQQGKGSSRP
ncbi:MAG: hypothetical protein HY343_01875 [Lentisphaerae bacterium]|nr:hypothetical protein [Lentisphaerota bacterium]